MNMERKTNIFNHFDNLFPLVYSIQSMEVTSAVSSVHTVNIRSN